MCVCHFSYLVTFVLFSYAHTHTHTIHVCRMRDEVFSFSFVFSYIIIIILRFSFFFFSRVKNTHTIINNLLVILLYHYNFIYGCGWVSPDFISYFFCILIYFCVTTSFVFRKMFRKYSGWILTVLDKDLNLNMFCYTVYDANDRWRKGNTQVRFIMQINVKFCLFLFIFFCFLIKTNKNSFYILLNTFFRTFCMYEEILTFEWYPLKVKFTPLFTFKTCFRHTFTSSTLICLFLSRSLILCNNNKYTHII